MFSKQVQLVRIYTGDPRAQRGVVFKRAKFMVLQTLGNYVWLIVKKVRCMLEE